MSFVFVSALGSGCAKTPSDGIDESLAEEVLRPAPGAVDTKPFECSATTDAGGFKFEKIGTWRDDAKAAYSMTHDDTCGPELRAIDRLAVPALARRNLTAALGAIALECAKENLWGVLRAAEERGNEIISHSYTHTDKISVQNAQLEIVGAKSELDRGITNPVTFYIYPYDYFTPETVEAVRLAGHLGARAGLRDDNDGLDNPPINSADPVNDFELEFDVWPRSYSKYALFRERDILSVHVWNAIERGGFAFREFHTLSIEDVPPAGGLGFGPVPLRIYEDHLDFLYYAWKANLVWTSTPTTIIRYRHARAACKASVTGNSIAYDTSAEECRRFATPISVVVTTGNDVPGLKATQAGNHVFTRKLGPNRFSVTADPTAGSIDLDGCVATGPAVDPTVTLPPKPTPAGSVCELERVVGTGSRGKMDDLERSNEQMQILPNPGQDDGRTGSWSWYPPIANARIVQDGRRNNAIRFSGGNHARFAGVTLAFIGGNGAGSCYDATAYTGIRFRAKGVVETPDATLKDKIIVSLVTAETQSRRLGGDLSAEAGGHFHKVMPLSTSGWQTYEIAWSEFGKPTWGPSTNLKELALSKLQAIDWGVSDKSPSYEIFVDDIELY